MYSAAYGMTQRILRLDILDELADQVEELGSRINRDEDYNDVLDSILELAFTTTGAGHYMRATNKLRLRIDQGSTVEL